MRAASPKNRSHTGTDRGHQVFARLAALAARQFGVVSRAQLLALGLSAATITRWAAEGRLVRIYRGVYAVGHANLTAASRRMAAVLGCGTGAALSHMTAADHLAMLRYDGSLIHISLPRHRSVRAKGRIRIHQTRLIASDVAIHGGIPATTPMRTLLDLASVVPPRRLREALEQTQRMQTFDRTELDPLIARGRGRKGTAALRRLLTEAGDDPPDLRSMAERRLRELVLDSDIPAAHYNAVVAGLTVDVYWPSHALVVEVDGYSYHRSREAFEEDHARTEHLQDSGVSVRRFTARRIINRGDEVVRAIRRALGLER